MGGRSLLAVFAHPDDESIAAGGLLAACADRGVKVSLLCVTRGELGGKPAGEHLAGIREAELRAAAAVLGIQELVLLDHRDGMLCWTDARTLETDIRVTILHVRPDVVVTFGEDGLYWHPDHVAVHDRTTAVVETMTAPPALYYVTIPPGCMRRLVDHVVSTVDPPSVEAVRRHVLGVEDVDAFGSQTTLPTLVLETGALARRKLAAIRCHATQVGDGVLSLLDEQDAERFLGTEHYRRADTGAPGRCFLDQLVS